MGLVSFFTDFSTEMVMSVLPLYIVKDLDLSELLGAIEGSGDFVNYIFRVLQIYFRQIRKKENSRYKPPAQLLFWMSPGKGIWYSQNLDQIG
jgi:hypothetical protein